MASVKVTRATDAIVIDSGYWQVRHRLSAGGCWDSIKFAKGSRKNLLKGVVNSRYRILDPHPTSDGSSLLFHDQSNEKSPAVDVQELPNGDVAVTVSGEYRDESGASQGVKFRQRYEYRRWGLVACELELDFTQERGDVVEVKAVEMPLRAGMTHGYVRKHPVEASGSDLTGGGTWYDLAAGSYTSRYVPIHIVAFEKGVEGIEFFPASNLDTWDKSLNAERGMGLYIVSKDGLELDPYCVAYRRNPTCVSGKYTFRYYLGLPFIKDAETVHSKYHHVGTGSAWASDDDIRKLARLGTKLLRFHNDYREKAPFWHDAMYPPYDEAGMKELRRVVNTAHEAGMKCVPYISHKEFHPESPGFKEDQAAWRREAGPTFKELHTWAGSGEFGQLMCLESGWLDRRKQDIETILTDIPWDGLYFDWCTPHPCRHPGHIPGAEYHTDADKYVDFMFWCRDRVGEDGIIFSHLSGLPYIFTENMSNLLFIYEDIGTIPAGPDAFPIQCRFIPINPRHLVGGPGDAVGARKFIVGGMLEGHPPCFHAPIEGFAQRMVDEMEQFGGEDLGRFRFIPASKRPIATGKPGVYAALWYRSGEALVYVANLTDKPARGAWKLDASRMGKKASALDVHQAGAKPKPARMSAGAVSKKGVNYSLAPWGSAVYRLRAAR